MQTPLYTHNKQLLRPSDFLKGLQAAGVRSGDTIFVHSAVLSFGKPAMENPETLLQALSDILKKAVGKKGTVIMPTFTYSFTKKEPFNVQRSPSTVGALTEYFRTEPGIERTKDPLFSVALHGQKTPLFSGTIQDRYDSYGKGSIFDLLYRYDAKIVFLGATVQSMTFLHYIEQSHGVPYRFKKIFRGTIVDGQKRYPATCTFYARYLSRNVETNTALFEKELRTKKLLREAHIGGGTIAVVSARDSFRIGMHILDKDICSLLEKKPS